MIVGKVLSSIMKGQLECADRPDAAVHHPDAVHLPQHHRTELGQGGRTVSTDAPGGDDSV